MLLGDGDGTFQPQVSYAVGSEPLAIVAGDFNGDGRTDLAVANSGDDTVSVLLGNGDGTFQPQVTYAVGSGPDAIVAGDFTGDGKLDLAVANAGDNTVSILLGNGDGTFQPQVTYAVGSAPDAIMAGDFTGDGNTDLAVVNGGTYSDNWSGSVSVLLGNGDGTFQPQVTYSVGPYPDAIVAGDFTDNGHLDLAVADHALSGPGTVSVLLGNGDGTFQPQVTYAVGVFPDAIVAGGFNGDGRTDLAVANGAYGTVSVLMGNGDGTFQPQVTYPVGWDTASISSSDFTSIVSSDFNGDGRDDLAVADNYYNKVWVLLGNGVGTFTAAGQEVTTPRATPLVADVNGDGTNDVLVVDGSGDILYRQGIPGQPGSFLPPVTVNPGNPSRDIGWVTNPGQAPVLASVDAHNNAVTLYAYQNGGFVIVGSLATGALPAQIITADLDDNGLTDLVVRNAGDGTLSVFYPVKHGVFPPQFSPAFTIPVGPGVSDVQAVDTTGSGRLDLVVTNALTAQVGIVPNLGGGDFGPLEPYRAGTGLSAIAPTGSPEVTSLEATAGVAAGPLTPRGPAGLVTINPGSNTLDVLTNMGDGRFSNPVTIPTQQPAQIIRMADLANDGIEDLVLLGTSQVTIMLGNGQGDFQKLASYNAGPEPDGLTIADINGDGIPDLLIGNAYGDLLILQGNGNGTFRPYRDANQDVALAVADLTGNGKPDFIYADQSLDRVVVQYGTSQTTVLADQTTGLLSPGAVKLADLTGNGIDDLIVANSGSNNVLVYPGLGNGQFGPALNDGNGYYVGTNPTGITVANLNGQPDLIVADSGSNDVSILLGEGSGANWTLVPGPRIGTDAGPVAVAVGNILGNGTQDLAVANQQADNVQVFTSIGGGFFRQNGATYPVGQAPDGLFLGDFSGSGTQIATLNGGSNSISLINPSAGGVTETIPTGGVYPTSGFAGDFTSNGYTDLVVGNTADGRIALFTGGAEGLNLSQSTTSAAVPSPTSLSFAGLSDGVLSFYAATAGREAASLLSFNLDTQSTSTAAGQLPGGDLAGETGQSTGAVLTATTTGIFQQAAQFFGLNGSALDLIAPLLTVSVVPGNLDTGAHGDAEIALLANFLPTTTTVTQRPGLPQSPSNPAGQTPEKAPEKEENPEDGEADLPIWAQLASGLERAWEQLRTRMLKREGIDPNAANQATSASSGHRSKAAEQVPRVQGQAHPVRSQTGLAPFPEVPQQLSQPGKQTFLDLIDAAIAELAEDDLAGYRGLNSPASDQDGETAIAHDRLVQPLAAAITLASMESLARWIRSSRDGRRLRRALAGESGLQRRTVERLPSALPWAGMFRPLRGILRFPGALPWPVSTGMGRQVSQGLDMEYPVPAPQAPQGVALGWNVPAPSGHLKVPRGVALAGFDRNGTSGFPRPRHGISCFGPTGTLDSRPERAATYQPRAIPWEP